MKIAKIKVIGIGGAGGNAISRMMRCKIKGVNLIALNTDLQDLKRVKAHQKIWVGKKITKGLGTGMNLHLGKRSIQESEGEISQVLKGADIIFLVAGLGGGTGTGGILAVADLAKKTGALTIGVVTLPFSFEGTERMKIAQAGLRELKGKVDTLLVIPNDRILTQMNQKITLSTAFWNCDEVLRQAIQGISDLIVVPGIINVDFADIRAVMENSGPAFFGVGKGKGKRKVEEAVEKAINSPLLNSSIKGARGILFNISGGEGLTFKEVYKIAQKISENTPPEAKIIFGAIQDRRLQKEEIRLTVIATGISKE